MAATLVALRDEHRHLLPHIEELRTTAAAVGHVDTAQLTERLVGNVAFLERHLLPHARAEDDVLYPVVAELLGGPDTTATMRRDHEEVAGLTKELAALRDRAVGGGEDVDEDLRRVLYGLHAVVRLHFAKEEEVYVPLLEHGLSEERAEAMLREMEDAHRRHTP